MSLLAWSIHRSELRKAGREAGAIFGIWTLIALISTSYTSLSRLQLNQTAEWGRSLVLNLIEWNILAAFTCPIVWLVRRWPLGPGHWRFAPMYLGVISVLVMLKHLLYLPVRRYFYPIPGITLSHAILESFFYEFFEMAAIVGAVHAVEYGRSVRDGRLRAAQLESRLAQARLEVLRGELQPHFLFNALHAISTMMYENVEAADEMLSQLADLLRLSLERKNVQVAALREELSVLEPYLNIVRTRFGDRLTIRMDVDSSALEVPVPLFILQPLVENAIHHGIARRAGSGRIDIQARLVGDFLQIAVTDDGAGLSAAAVRDGVGLSNTRLRLEQLYGAAGKLDLKNRADSGTEVVVTIPRSGRRAGEIQR